MLKHSLNALALGATLALSAGGAWAQTTSTVNPPDTKIGVTPQDAKEATDKAVPRADTGTLVRTAPSAADRAGDMANDARNAARPPLGTNGSTAAPGPAGVGTTNATPNTGASRANATPAGNTGTNVNRANANTAGSTGSTPSGSTPPMNTTPGASTGATGAQPDAIMAASNRNTRRNRAARADRN